MTELHKQKDKDFVILNLGDIQLSEDDWRDKNDIWYGAIHTVVRLVSLTKPDLITCNGDISYGGCDSAYRAFASFMESLAVPWAPVMGNHDYMAGEKGALSIADIYESVPHCLFKRGDKGLGFGNYSVKICEEGAEKANIIFLDSHDMVDCNGSRVYDKLMPLQLEWYKQELKGFNSENLTVMHIPPHCLAEAYKKAKEENQWENGIAFGERCEVECGAFLEDGFDKVLEETKKTTQVLVGHDHLNSYSVMYKGVRYTYGLKTGMGCYGMPEMNGGTVITVSNGFEKPRHVNIPL